MTVCASVPVPLETLRRRRASLATALKTVSLDLSRTDGHPEVRIIGSSVQDLMQHLDLRLYCEKRESARGRAGSLSYHSFYEIRGYFGGDGDARHSRVAGGL